MKIKLPSALLVTQLVIAGIPIVFYILVFSYLPEKIATHYGVTGTSYSGKDSITMIAGTLLGYIGVLFGAILEPLARKAGGNSNDSDPEDTRVMIRAIGVFLTVLLSLLAFFMTEFTPLMHTGLPGTRILRILYTFIGMLLIVTGSATLTTRGKAARQRVRRPFGWGTLLCGLAELAAGVLPFIPDSAAMFIQPLLYLIPPACLILSAVAYRKANG